MTWNQIHEIIADAVGVKPNIVHISSNFLCEYDDSFKGSLWGDKSYSVIFDNTKIKTFVPGFCCIIPFSEGIKRTLAWFEADPKRMVIKKETNDKIDDIIKKYGG